jgi:NADH-quinone oxidoreductase subunit N
MTPELTANDLHALSPLLILFMGSLGILLMESFASAFAKKYALYATLGILLAAGISAFYAPPSANPLLTPWIRFDGLTKFFNLFFIAIGFGVTLISPRFHGEYFFLTLSSVIGLLLIGASADFLTLFLGIEALSIPLYILCGFIKKREISHESAVKYFLTGALATAFLVYGIALLYGATGTTKLDLLLNRFQGLDSTQDLSLFFGGIVFITIALLFKAAIAPFHQWAPDVYAGAPTSVTSFMAIGTKAGAFAALLGVFLVALPNFDVRWNEAISWLAILTLLYANFVALKQTQMRRFFAYSGIAQAGFLLIPFAAGTEDAKWVLLFYLVIYALATLGCFAVLSALDDRQEGVRLQDLRGLYKRSPYLCLIFSLCLLTLAGLPPTAGFLAKFLILKEAFAAGYLSLVIVGLLCSILSIYYYLRPIAIMLGDAPEGKSIRSKDFWREKLTGYAVSIAIIAISLFPYPLWNYLREIK